jgi:hypothetical protein
VLGGIAAAAAVAAGFARVRAIQGTPLAEGGEVPGGFPNDSFPARLTSGETVVNRDTTSQLKDFLGSNSANRDILASIDTKLSRLSMATVVNIGNKTIIDEVRSGLNDGRMLEVSA